MGGHIGLQRMVMEGVGESDQRRRSQRELWRVIEGGWGGS